MKALELLEWVSKIKSSPTANKTGVTPSLVNYLIDWSLINLEIMAQFVWVPLYRLPSLSPGPIGRIEIKKNQPTIGPVPKYLFELRVDKFYISPDSGLRVVAAGEMPGYLSRVTGMDVSLRGDIADCLSEDYAIKILHTKAGMKDPVKIQESDVKYERFNLDNVIKKLGELK